MLQDGTNRKGSNPLSSKIRKPSIVKPESWKQVRILDALTRPRTIEIELKKIIRETKISLDFTEKVLLWIKVSILLDIFKVMNITNKIHLTKETLKFKIINVKSRKKTNPLITDDWASWTMSCSQVDTNRGLSGGYGLIRKSDT